MFVFADEIHTLECAVTKSFSWILTHYTSNDACIPYTIYNKVLLETVGLSEFGMRLPALLSGALLLVFIAWVTGKYLSPVTSILSTGIIAFSPYFVYISREARPYSITVLLFSLSAFLIFLWERNRQKTFFIYLSVMCAAVCIYFHPVVTPSFAVILAYPAVMIILNGHDKRFFKHYIISLVLFVCILILLLGPAMPSLLEGIGHKESLGKADIKTLEHGMMLLLSIPVCIPVWVWIVSGIVGCYFFSKRYFRETICFLIITFFQIGALFFMQPELQEISWVFFRYIVHIVPIYVVICIAGFSGCMEKLMVNLISKRMGLIFSFSVIIFFMLYHLNAHHYRVRQTDRFKAHPMVVFLSESDPLQDIKKVVSPFYLNEIEHLPSGGISEAPMLVTFPLYGIYQKWHHRNIVTTPLGEGFNQNILEYENGLQFKTLISKEKMVDKSSGVRYLIVHKRIKEEMAMIFNLLAKDNRMATQLMEMAYLFEDRLLNYLFGRDELNFEIGKTGGVKLVYEDYYISVYDLFGNTNN